MDTTRKNKAGVLLAALLGLVLPLGNIWGPYLVKSPSKEVSSYRTRVVIAEAAISIGCFIWGVCVWIRQIRLSENGSDTNVAQVMCWGAGFYAILLLFALANIGWLMAGRR